MQYCIWSTYWGVELNLIWTNFTGMIFSVYKSVYLFIFISWITSLKCNYIVSLCINKMYTTKLWVWWECVLALSDLVFINSYGLRYLLIFESVNFVTCFYASSWVLSLFLLSFCKRIRILMFMFAYYLFLIIYLFRLQCFLQLITYVTVLVYSINLYLISAWTLFIINYV